MSLHFRKDEEKEGKNRKKNTSGGLETSTLEPRINQEKFQTRMTEFMEKDQELR